MDTDNPYDCIEKCIFPKDAVLKEVPVPRHNWGDVLVCPNDGCGKAFLVVKAPPRPEGESEEGA